MELIPAANRSLHVAFTERFGRDNVNHCHSRFLELV